LFDQARLRINIDDKRIIEQNVKPRKRDKKGCSKTGKRLQS
jgi:hypothetical protein